MKQMNANAEVMNSGLDRWLQRAAVTAMVVVGLVLLGIGVSLYV